MAPEVRGRPVDDETRCAHWSSRLDIVAFRFPCCKGWWPCRSCHDDAVDHDTEVWGTDQRDVEAVRCGACSRTLTIDAYVSSNHACPRCGAAFNPGCQDHWPAYFEVDGS